MPNPLSRNREFGLLCPQCESHKIRVYDSRPKNGTVERLRYCFDCHCRFATHEKFVRICRHQKHRRVVKPAAASMRVIPP